MLAPFATHSVCMLVNTDEFAFADCRLRCCVCGTINVFCGVCCSLERGVRVFANIVFATLESERLPLTLKCCESCEVRAKVRGCRNERLSALCHGAELAIKPG